MGQRQKGPNYVLQKITKVPLSIKYQRATIIGGAHVQYIYTMYIYIDKISKGYHNRRGTCSIYIYNVYIYKLSAKFESPGLKTVRGVDYTK